MTFMEFVEALEKAEPGHTVMMPEHWSIVLLDEAYRIVAIRRRQREARKYDLQADGIYLTSN